jgi:hypothetical protein
MLDGLRQPAALLGLHSHLDIANNLSYRLVVDSVLSLGNPVENDLTFAVGHKNSD